MALQRRLLTTLYEELANPLLTVRLAANLLDGPAPESVRRRAVSALRRAGERMIGVLDEVNDFARLRPGLARASRQPLCFEVIAQQALDGARRLHPEQEFVLELRAEDPGGWEQAPLTQLLRNLLLLALQSGVSARPIRLATRSSARFPMIIEVQAPALATRPGLRLALVQCLVEAQGGKLKVRRDALGTTFSVGLPGAS